MRRRSRACTVEASEPSSTTRMVPANAARIALRALFRKPALGDAGVAGKEPLQGFGLGMPASEASV